MDNSDTAGRTSSGRARFLEELEDGIRKLIENINLTRHECPLPKLKEVRETLVQMPANSDLNQSEIRRLSEMRSRLESVMIIIDGLMSRTQSERLRQVRTDIALWIRRIDTELKK